MGIAQLHNKLVLDHHVCGGSSRDWRILFAAVILARHGPLCSLRHHRHDPILFEWQRNTGRNTIGEVGRGRQSGGRMRGWGVLYCNSLQQQPQKGRKSIDLFHNKQFSGHLSSTPFASVSFSLYPLCQVVSPQINRTSPVLQFDTSCASNKSQRKKEGRKGGCKTSGGGV